MPARIVIMVEGGVVQDVFASEPVEAILIDQDCEDEEEGKLIKDMRGTDFLAAIGWYSVECTPKVVKHYFRQLDERREPEPHADWAAKYRVKWEIDLDGATPRAAAELAWRIQHDPSSLATEFEVTDKKDKTVTVDLSKE